MLEIRLMTLEGKFAVAARLTARTMDEAVKIVEGYVSGRGFVNVKVVDGEDPDSWRITARTPGGRGGRNVAFVDAMP